MTYKSIHGRYPCRTRLIQVLGEADDGESIIYREGRKFGSRWFVPDNAPVGTMSKSEFESNFRPTGERG